MHKNGQKYVNSVKTTFYYGPKKLIRFPIIPSVHQNIIALMTIFGQKRPFSKKQTALMSIFFQKTSISKENSALMSFFSKIFQKILPSVKPIIFGQ